MRNVGLPRLKGFHGAATAPVAICVAASPPRLRRVFAPDRSSQDRLIALLALGIERWLGQSGQPDADQVDFTPDLSVHGDAMPDEVKQPC